jgi:hypothetical protein
MRGELTPPIDDLAPRVGAEYSLVWRVGVFPGGPNSCKLAREWSLLYPFSGLSFPFYFKFPI